MSVYPTDLAHAAKMWTVTHADAGGITLTSDAGDVLTLHADVEAQLADVARHEARQARLDEIRREIADDRDELRRERDES